LLLLGWLVFGPVAFGLGFALLVSASAYFSVAAVAVRRRWTQEYMSMEEAPPFRFGRDTTSGVAGRLMYGQELKAALRVLADTPTRP
jgi:hypothetical protein